MKKYRSILIGNGLTNIPAKICSISSSGLKNDIGNGCHLCEGFIGHKNYCKSCGNFPEKDEIIKVLKMGKEDRISINPEIIAQLKAQDKKVEVLGSFSRNELDGIVLGMTENVYYIFEDEKMGQAKALGILKYGLENTDMLFVVQTSITGSNKIGLLRSEKIQGQNVLLLQLVKYMEYANKIDEKYTVELSKEEQQLGIEYAKGQTRVDLNSLADPTAVIMQQILDGKQDVTIPEAIKKKEDDLSFFKVPEKKKVEVKA